MANVPSPDPHSSARPSLGLSGLWASVANFSAVVVMAGLFVAQSAYMLRTAEIDRAMCREESARQWAAVREGQAAILRLTRNVEDLATEVRALRGDATDERRMRSKSK